MEGSQPAQRDTELVAQEQTRNRKSASRPEAAVVHSQASPQSSEVGSMLGQRHSRLSALLARSSVGCMDNGYTKSKQPPHEQHILKYLALNRHSEICMIGPRFRIRKGGQTVTVLA